MILYIGNPVKKWCLYLTLFLLKDKYPNFEVGLKCIIMVF